MRIFAAAVVITRPAIADKLRRSSLSHASSFGLGVALEAEFLTHKVSSLRGMGHSQASPGIDAASTFE